MAKTKARGNGDGSIYRRGSDGRWCGTVTVGSDEVTGRLKRRTVYGKTRSEVVDKMKAVEKQRDNGIVVTKGSVNEWFTHWLEHDAKNSVRPSTWVSYESVTRLDIIPRLGTMRLAKVKAITIEKMLARMRADGRSARQIQKAYAVMRRCFSQAVKKRLLDHNPCDRERMDPPKYKSPTVEALTTEQAIRLLDASKGHRLSALIVLAVLTGLRQGELFALTWDDIDLKSGTISVRRTLVRAGSYVSFDEPKTQSGRRTVKIDSVAIDALNEHRRQMMAEGNAGAELVFVALNGSPLHRSNFLRLDFQPLVKAAGLVGTKFHHLRHTSASLLLKQGVHPKVVQNRLGHSRVAITLDVYSHLVEGMDTEAASAIGAILSPEKDSVAVG